MTISETKIQLTKCQLKAKSEIEAWLVDTDRPEFILSGGAGVGKSTLLDLILKDIKQVNDICELLGQDQRLYDVLFTATTNKAASVIQGDTIFAMLGISIYNDFKTGEVNMNTKNAKHRYNSLIIVDESSMVDEKLLDEIRRYCNKCKILYVGDINQLHPVGLTYSPVFDGDIESVHMTTPCRQDYNSHLYNEICKVRDWVQFGGEIPTIVEGKGVTYINDIGLVDFVENPSNSDKIVTFTNDSCIQLNQFVRLKRGLPLEFFTEGEEVMSNTTTVTNNKYSKRILTDAQYTISNIGPVESHNGWFDYRTVYLDGIRAHVPTNPIQFKSILAKLKAKKDWRAYFNLKESYVDIRDAYAITVHKSQGSTYERVLINLSNFKRCPDKLMLARLLYVAISRAKSEVYLYGTLM